MVQLKIFSTYDINRTEMKPTEDEALKEVVRILSEMLNQEPAKTIAPRPLEEDAKTTGGKPDAIAESRDVAFVIEYKQSGNVSSVEAGIRQLENASKYPKQSIRLLAVPYMHEMGKERCRKAEISWLDLSGNADIRGSGLHISVQGKPDLFKSPGRPLNPFAPRSSRVARTLIYHPEMSIRQRDLAEMTGLGKGYVSHVVRALESQGLLVRMEDRSVKARDPSLLLDAWLEAYSFNKHELIRGRMAARSGTSHLRNLSLALRELGIEHAATGLGAAWLYTKFADFRLVSLLLHERISTRDLSDIGLVEAQSGANTWLILPFDDSVFWETTIHDEIPTVHPIQAYLDLKGHPERANEAAEELKRAVLDLGSR